MDVTRNENGRRGDFGRDEPRELSADEGCVHEFCFSVRLRCVMSLVVLVCFAGGSDL